MTIFKGIQNAIQSSKLEDHEKRFLLEKVKELVSVRDYRNFKLGRADD